MTDFLSRNKKTVLAVLDSTIIPKWTRPPSLLSEDVPCGAWETLRDPPTHFEVSYELLESDNFGRTPGDPMYQYCPKSALYYIARCCMLSLDKVRSSNFSVWGLLFVVVVVVVVVVCLFVC